MSHAGPVGWADLTEFRAEFVRLLTVDSETKDARRKGYNQAIFDAGRGHAIWTSTDLEMVLSKFDKAARNVGVKVSPA